MAGNHIGLRATSSHLQRQDLIKHRPEVEYHVFPKSLVNEARNKRASNALLKMLHSSDTQVVTVFIECFESLEILI